jgi:hypothetical protein
MLIIDYSKRRRLRLFLDRLFYSLRRSVGSSCEVLSRRDKSPGSVKGCGRWPFDHAQDKFLGGREFNRRGGASAFDIRQWLM